MVIGTATYAGDELEVVFTATGELTDYGVQGSPTWVEWGTPTVESVTLLGQPIDFEALASDAQTAITELAAAAEFEETY